MALTNPVGHFRFSTKLPGSMVRDALVARKYDFDRRISPAPYYTLDLANQATLRGCLYAGQNDQHRTNSLFLHLL